MLFAGAEVMLCRAVQHRAHVERQRQLRGRDRVIVFAPAWVGQGGQQDLRRRRQCEEQAHRRSDGERQCQASPEHRPQTESGPDRRDNNRIDYGRSQEEGYPRTGVAANT